MNITIKDKLLIINFKGNKSKMNEMLDSVSNNYEGIIKNREGHNFPTDIIPVDHFLYKYRKMCQYVIGVYNVSCLPHELKHAKYFMDKNYKRK